MKNIFKIISTGILMILMNSCASQSSITPEHVSELLNKGEFTFMAERANPTGSDVVNIMNSLPNSTSSQILNLDYGYTMEIKKNELTLTLPYFGRMYTPNYDNTKNSYRLTSKDFTMTHSSGKKGSTLYTILPKDQQNIRRIMLDVYKNGKAYLSIDANDRQGISYDGYIMENVVAKK